MSDYAPLWHSFSMEHMQSLDNDCSMIQTVQMSSMAHFDFKGDSTIKVNLTLYTLQLNYFTARL